MEYWVYEFWDRFIELQEKAVDPVIKTWSLNSNLRIGTSPELEAWHKRNIWFGVDHDMTKEALKYHEEILNSYLIGFSCESPEYLEMMDAYMKGTFFDFFYTKEFVYWIKKEDPEEPYYEKDAIYFKRQGKYDIVTSDYYQVSKGGTFEALDEWLRTSDDEIELIRYRPIKDLDKFPPLKNFIEMLRH